jgi:hypothetical protein
MSVAVANRQSGEVFEYPGEVGLVPSLDLCSESVDGMAAQICPKRPYVLQARERPELVFPASCDAYGCDLCGPRKAEQTAALITWAIREAARRGSRSRLVTLTLAPDDWQTRRQKVRDLHRWARECGYEWHMAWASERGSDTGMLHCHGVQHGRSKVPQRALQARWGAIVDIRAIRTPDAGLYAMKEALRVAGYAVKNATQDAQGLRAHLDLNGGRAAHWSRGFLHGLTKREALAELRSELAGGERLTWQLIPAFAALGQPTTCPA